MPELPEVETVVRGIAPVLIGRKLCAAQQRRSDMRFPFPKGLATRLQDKRVEAVERRAKYILIRLNSGETLMIHLGMSGRLTLLDMNQAKQQPYAKHDHFIFQTHEGSELRFNDPRRFGFVDLFLTAKQAAHPRFVTLGPEPLGNAFSGPILQASLSKRKSALKVCLMDQKVVVGVGNIYACESLFLAKLHPEMPACALSLNQCEDLAQAVKVTLAKAIEAGGSSLNDYVQASGELGYFQHQFAVYGRENKPCYSCQSPVQRSVQAQRSSFYCNQCQSR